MEQEATAALAYFKRLQEQEEARAGGAGGAVEDEGRYLFVCGKVDW